MSRIVSGLYVGDIDCVNSLFGKDAQKLSQVISGSCHSLDNEKIGGVITVCPWLPNWCNCKHTETFTVPEELQKFLKSQTTWIKSLDYDRGYIDLHLDLVEVPAQNGDAYADAYPGNQTMILHAVVRANDYDFEPLHKAFDFTYRFVEHVKVKLNASTFIHCMAGMSRSTTLVCAYLIKKWATDFESVFTFVQARHPPTCPSDGFIRQLKQFQRGNKHLQATCNENGKAEADDVSEESEANLDYLYTCKTCREALFYSRNTISHDSGAKNSASFQLGNKVDNSACRQANDDLPRIFECTSIFVEPMDWMGNLELQEGKINCKNHACTSKLGYFSWHGRRCSCGFLQVPAFQIQLSKVDRLETDSKVKGKIPKANSLYAE